MKNLTKSLFIASIALMGVAGSLYAATLTIPTGPATHDARLRELILGKQEATQVLKLDTATQQRLIIEERLIAGSENNIIDESSAFAIIAGGGSYTEKNQI
jgi:hypothetical protein